MECLFWRRYECLLTASSGETKTDEQKLGRGVALVIKSLQSCVFLLNEWCSQSGISACFSFCFNHASWNCDSHSNTCLDGAVTFDLSVDIVLWDWSDALVPAVPITYQGDRRWDGGSKGGGVVSEGNENKSLLPRTPSAVQNPNPGITTPSRQIAPLNIVHSTITRTDQSQLELLF